VNRHKAGQFVKIGQTTLQITGKASQHGSQSLHRLAHRDLSFYFYQLRRFFLHQDFKIFGVFPELLTHKNFFMGPVQGNFENIIVNRFGDKINRLILEAFNRQVHVTMTGNHNDFGIGIFVLYFSEELDTVHSRHFNVGQNDGRVFRTENFEGVFTIFSSKHLIADIR